MKKTMSELILHGYFNRNVFIALVNTKDSFLCLIFDYWCNLKFPLKNDRICHKSELGDTLLPLLVTQDCLLPVWIAFGSWSKSAFWQARNNKLWLQGGSVNSIPQVKISSRSLFHRGLRKNYSGFGFCVTSIAGRHIGIALAIVVVVVVCVCVGVGGGVGGGVVVVRFSG